jgi:hypothetical protein
MTAPSIVDAAPSSEAQGPVKQWFCGPIEASYYGIQSKVPVASSDSVGRRYRLHIYRAAMLQIEMIDAPEPTASANRCDAVDTDQATLPEPFFQDSIQIAQLWGVRGPGTRYEGPIHDVSITQPQTRFHVVKDGKSYGTLRGYARGWLYLPPAVAPEPILPIELAHSDRANTPGVLIREPAQESASSPSTKSTPGPLAKREAPQGSIDDADSDVRIHKGLSPKAEPPYFSLSAAIGLLLWFTCSAEQTWIWCLFMLPTLGVRRLVHEALPDERGVRAFSAVMILGAVLSSITIFSGFGTQGCWTLEPMPLAVLVGSVFLSGILPYRLPLAITALLFASVLFMWGHAPERHCTPDTEIESLPTIKDPGVPRTNNDGSWPRRAPPAETTPQE